MGAYSITCSIYDIDGSFIGLVMTTMEKSFEKRFHTRRGWGTKDRREHKEAVFKTWTGGKLIYNQYRLSMWKFWQSNKSNLRKQQNSNRRVLTGRRGNEVNL